MNNRTKVILNIIGAFLGIIAVALVIILQLGTKYILGTENFDFLIIYLDVSLVVGLYMAYSCIKSLLKRDK